MGGDVQRFARTAAETFRKKRFGLIPAVEGENEQSFHGILFAVESMAQKHRGF